MSDRFSLNVLFKYFYHMNGILLWTFHILWNCEIPYFPLLLWQLSSCILHLFILPVHSYQYSMFGTGSETSIAIPKNTFIFSWTNDVKQCNFRLRTWDDVKALARFHPSPIMGALIYLLCVSSTKWSFHLPWKCQACKREPPKPINRILLGLCKSHLTDLHCQFLL